MSAENNKEEKDGTTSPDDRFERKHDPFVNKQDLEVLIEASDGGPNPKKKRFGYGAIILLAVAAKILIWPTMQTAFYEFKHKSGHGWDHAMGDFKQHFESDLKAVTDIPGKYAKSIASCRASAYVAWLNKSGCRGYRVSFLTSAEEHQKELGECLTNAGEDEFSEANLISCIKQEVPNKWSEFEEVYANRYFSSFQEAAEKGLMEKDNRVLADCMAKKYIEKMESLASLAGENCGPIDMNAEKIEGLFTDTPCAKDVRRVVNPQLKAFGKACIDENLTVAH